MLSVQDFIAKYENYSDEELYEINSTISGYSEEAKEALEIVLQKKGGIDEVIKRLQSKKVISQEIARIEKEAHKLSSKETDASFLKTLIKSDILPQDKVHEIIDYSFAKSELERNDKAINSKTILGSFFGCAIASIVGGTLWGLQLIYSQRIFLILAIGLGLLCYGIIKLLTKKSNKNTAVLIATVIAVILSTLLGQLLYAIVGYQG